MFTIIIPSWNNLDFLKLCINSIRDNSQSDHEIIIHINDGSDGSLEWVESQGIKYSHTQKNIGVCLAVNRLVAQASHDWVLYMNDDMVACPGWDTAFAKAIESSDTDLVLFFGTLIQADNGKHSHIIKQNFGTTPQNFDGSRLLQEYSTDARDNVESGESQPTMFHRKWWMMVGGYSLEFSPGMSSDNDLLMKFWVVGSRRFSIISASRFYHFSCKSTERVRRNKGGRIFLMKWGITQREFKRLYLEELRSGSHTGTTRLFSRFSLSSRFRRALYSLLCNHPLQDIGSWDSAPGQKSKR